MKPRVLFITKFREQSGGYCGGYDGSSDSLGGLFNSAKFVVDMLLAAGVEARLSTVKDNNTIDAEVKAFQPTLVILEALWTVPEKFAVLTKLYPDVRWIVRCHSEIPFLAYEGVAVDWIGRYVRERKVSVASNSTRALNDFRRIVSDANPSWSEDSVDAKVVYLPNSYPVLPSVPPKPANGFLDIGCFGALRPLKNQLIQALAAIEFAKQKHAPLRFHINHRCEQGGESVLKNLRALFHGSNFLIEHEWQERDAFLKTLAGMNIGMQVSLSETFDITAADTVSLGIPIVTSSEIVWSAEESQANPNDTNDIVDKLGDVTGMWKGWIKRSNLSGLRNYAKKSRSIWLKAIQ